MNKFSLYGILRRFNPMPTLGDIKGVVSVETAIIGSVLSVMALGIVDFSMAYSRQSQMANAVRAGVQFALVRRPSIGPSAETQESIISLQTIREAVIDSANFLESDPGTQDLSASVFCQCPDTQPVTCVSEPSVPLPCAQRRTFLQISLKQNYTPLFNYPLIPAEIPLEASNSIRLN
jgi:hypothetical protein